MIFYIFSNVFKPIGLKILYAKHIKATQKTFMFLLSRKSYSVTNYPEGFWAYQSDKHQQFHYHIAPNAKWTNGIDQVAFHFY